MRNGGASDGRLLIGDDWAEQAAIAENPVFSTKKPQALLSEELTASMGLGRLEPEPVPPDDFDQSQLR